MKKGSDEMEVKGKKKKEKDNSHSVYLCKYRDPHKCTHPKIKDTATYDLDSSDECGDCIYQEKDKKSKVRVRVFCEGYDHEFSSIQSFEECYNSVDMIGRIEKLMIDNFPICVSIRTENLNSADIMTLKDSKMKEMIQESIEQRKYTKNMGEAQGFIWRYLYYTEGGKVKYRPLKVTKQYNSLELISNITALIAPNRRFYLVTEGEMIYELNVRFRYNYTLDFGDGWKDHLSNS
jgi:hypothetical protein